MATERHYDLGNVDSDDFHRKVVEMHRDTLVSFRGQANNEEQLEWEIRLYDYILQDPTMRHRQYQRIRYENSDGTNRRIPLSKEEIVKELGWDVP